MFWTKFLLSIFLKVYFITKIAYKDFKRLYSYSFQHIYLFNIR